MQKGLKYLLDKYSVKVDATLSEDGKSVKIDGEDFPVLPWESERRFIELRNLVTLGRVGNMCTYRIGHTAWAEADIFEVLEREIGILEFTVNSKAKEIFAIRGKGTMNCIVEAENGCVCTIEIGATLTEGEGEVDKHEIITDCGVACDRVVDTQIPQSSIYVRGNKSATYTDTDAELYDYSELQINTIRNAFAIAKDESLRASNKEKYEHIKKVVAAAKKSLDTLENIALEA